MNVLIVTAVQSEKKAILQGLTEPYAEHVLAAGVGSLYAAIQTMEQMSRHRYDLLLNLGIGGGFPSQAEVGSVVIADEMIAADWGAESPEGFLEYDQLGFGCQRIESDADGREKVVHALRMKGIPYSVGPILTVSTTTGTKQSADQLLRRFPQAAAEGMEGFGVAAVAKHMNVPVLEMRTISNLVGPRDRQSWRIKDALERLTELSSILQEVLL